LKLFRIDRQENETDIAWIIQIGDVGMQTTAKVMIANNHSCSAVSGDEPGIETWQTNRYPRFHAFECVGTIHQIDQQIEIRWMKMIISQTCDRNQMPMGQDDGKDHVLEREPLKTGLSLTEFHLLSSDDLSNVLSNLISDVER
jgi:hypothetical protein